MASTIPGYYTVDEAADILKKSPEAIRRYIRLAMLPSKTIGRQRLIEQGDLHQFSPRPRGNPNFQSHQKS